MPYEIRILASYVKHHIDRLHTPAIKKALNSGTFVLPIHDWPARVESGRIASRLVGGSVPGPDQPVDHRTTAETSAMGLGAGRFWV